MVKEAVPEPEPLVVTAVIQDVEELADQEQPLAVLKATPTGPATADCCGDAETVNAQKLKLPA
jgi:hypothetical protein